MHDPEDFYRELNANDFSFFTGIPDSLLKDLCACIENESLSDNHIIAANEGNAIAIASGYYLSTRKFPVVYLQNSGLGNIINPVTSLCMPFGIYPLLVIGHRHTLPQHKIMGETDRQILELIGYENYIIIDGENNDK